ncbi:uncharacterized protein LOC126150865 [Schistocerca cancellata]|uniref:uncharacterized protein LOC126150865 n=1 Tax=Schistocerca cancellata TaxID=274614 RepID=UPI002117EA52|nr:uncharacterized protein LOC126150865 [Schistocerca cancellata]
MQAVQYKPVYGRNFVKENTRSKGENASPDFKVRTFTPALSRSKPDRCIRRNSKVSTPKNKALVASLHGIFNKSRSASRRKYLPRYHRSHQEERQKAKPSNSSQYSAPLNLQKKQLSVSLRKSKKQKFHSPLLFT